MNDEMIDTDRYGSDASVTITVPRSLYESDEGEADEE